MTMDGILIINKEKGFTSHDVVAKLRGILRQKKIGHTGTLDPDAEGVLPVCLGRATRASSHLLEEGKSYDAVLRLGVTTDTQDMSGRILSVSEQLPGEAAVREVMASFTGEILQVPPMYSALKIDGQKLVNLARAGREIPREPRPVTIEELTIRKIDLPRVTFSVSCSKGTYIRTLCHDIGEKLMCGGAMEALVRTKAAGFTLEQSLRLSEVETLAREGRIGEYIVPLDEIFRRLPHFYVLPEWEKALSNGNPLRRDWGSGEAPEEELTAVCFQGGTFAALYQWNTEKQRLMPVTMFLGS